MSYQVLAQKYRPQTFDDVIGQEAATRTLTNSIKNQRIANAYIFCGPRGTGKTSVARLLSKTLNCEQPPEKAPCNRCDSCREISAGSNIDVLEIDGASNRGIDEIRALRENVKFSPSKGKYKIYIIDEVHMLTTEAFNALLKTLEEPPAHVRFIFATTEAHKVLPTIMSRCQRFDFKKIPPKLILDRINAIAGAEKIEIDEKAAIMIARAADGSLRDGLVILDQMVSFSGNKVLADDVVELLGMVHKDKMFQLSDAIIGRDTRAVAVTVDELINNGKDPVYIANSLINHFRDLMIIRSAGAPTRDMAFTPEETERINEQLEGLSLEDVLYILQNLSHCITLMKTAMFARAPLEITLIRLAKRADALSVEEMLKRLRDIEASYGTRSVQDSRTVPPSGSTKPAASSEKKTPDALKKAASLNQTIEDETDTGNTLGRGDFETAQKHWRSVLHYVKSKKMSLFTFLNTAKPVEFDNNKVVIGFSNEYAFNKEVVEAGANKSLIEEAVNKVTGAQPRLEFAVLDFLGEEPPEKTNDKIKEKQLRDKEAMKPSIEGAMDVFGGHIVRDITEGQI